MLYSNKLTKTFARYKFLVKKERLREGAAWGVFMCECGISCWGRWRGIGLLCG